MSSRVACWPKVYLDEPSQLGGIKPPAIELDQP